MRSQARDVHEITTDEIRRCAVSFAGKLDAGEVLSGTPTVTVSGTSGLVLSAKTVNSVALTINDLAVPIGGAVQFTATATAATAGEWPIDITCTTTAGQTVFGRVRVLVVAS
jgi:hypothetical protein